MWVPPGPPLSSRRKRSSRAAARVRPPIARKRPAGSWGTIQVYWAELPSTKPPPPRLSYGLGKAPSAKRGSIMPLAGLKSLRQLAERCMKRR